MRTAQVTYIRSAVVAVYIGTTLTVAACAQNAPAPSYPSPAPQRSVPVVTYPAPPAVGSPVAVPAAPTREANQPAPPGQSAPDGAVTPTEADTPPTVAIGQIGPQPQPGGGLVVVPTQVDSAPPPPETGTATGTPPPYGDIIFQEPPASESPQSPAIIGNETSDTGPIDGG
jgi:hypothetical protein